jgi:hypothetical protein
MTDLLEGWWIVARGDSFPGGFGGNEGLVDAAFMSDTGGALGGAGPAAGRHHEHSVVARCRHHGR